jgi:photosystem II stability/assembly factor-like uncharacterized protein
MRGDFSRVTFHPENHFSGVLLQQGRVQLDAEFNEHVAIEAYRDRATARDVIGRAGAPIDGGGFAITVASMLCGVAAGDDAWAVGEDRTVLRSAGATGQWTIEPVPAATGRLNAVDIAQASGWAVGDAAAILRLAGTSWTSERPASEITADLHGVHADANGAWAVGTAGTVLSWNGTEWERQAEDADVTATLRDVHFAGDTGVAVGDDGTILATANRGEDWTVQTAPEGAGDLHGVFLVDAQHAWAVGAQGTVLFFDGAAWAYQSVSPRVTTTLRAVVFRGTNEGTAIGDGGLALAFDNGAWQHESTGVDADLLALAALPSGAMLAAGDDVTLTRSGPGEAWQPAPAMPADTDGARGRTLAISAGAFYVQGVRCENECSVSLDRQPEPPLDAAEFPPAKPGTYGVFLHVQEQHLTATEREELREVALGGPDSATRTRTVWQAGLVELGDPDASCAEVAALSPADPPRGRLRARAVPAAVSTSECIVPPNGGYRRLENQLYRVEIHDGTAAGAATYTWSRDNGSVIARLEGITTDAVKKTVAAEVSHTGRDAAVGFGPEQIVELTDEGRLLRSEPGVLLEVQEILGAKLVLSNPHSLSLSMDDFPINPIVRRWDGGGTVQFGKWIELEDGVFVEFAEGPDSGDAFRTGDYWTIPARTLSGRVEWPQTGGVPRFDERQGPRRHTAPLAIATVDADGRWSGVRDCRDLFPPLTGLTTLHYVGGDGQEAAPDPTLASAPFVKLDQPLQVAVSNWRWPVAGAIIEFDVIAGGGRLNGTADSMVTVETGADGVAACEWYLNAADPAPTTSQQVRATFQDADGLAIQTPIIFTANLSVAAEVAYDGRICARFEPRRTVQQAIDALVTLPRLYHRGGDGSHAAPGAAVALQVGVASDCGPDVDERKVRFEILAGDGALEEVDPEGIVVTKDGSAACTYRMGDELRHQVEARLIGEDGKSYEPPVVFTISRIVARDVMYEPGCETLRVKEVDSVQDAITALCIEIESGEPSVEAAHVLDIQLRQSGRSIELDGRVTASELANEHIRVVCDRTMSGAVLGGMNPPLRLIVDLPYPLSDSDRQLWGMDRPFGIQPIILRSGTDNEGDSIIWVAQPETQEWLTGPLFSVLANVGVTTVFARLQLLGNFILARTAPDTSPVFLDAELFGQRPGDLQYPSGDGRRGGVGEMWFNLVAG